MNIAFRFYFNYRQDHRKNANERNGHVINEANWYFLYFNLEIYEITIVYIVLLTIRCLFQIYKKKKKKKRKQTKCDINGERQYRTEHVQLQDAYVK